MQRARGGKCGKTAEKAKILVELGRFSAKTWTESGFLPQIRGFEPSADILNHFCLAKS
jgi:hypothetical protein